MRTKLLDSCKNLFIAPMAPNLGITHDSGSVVWFDYNDEKMYYNNLASYTWYPYYRIDYTKTYKYLRRISEIMGLYD